MHYLKSTFVLSLLFFATFATASTTVQSKGVGPYTEAIKITITGLAAKKIYENTSINISYYKGKSRDGKYEKACGHAFACLKNLTRSEYICWEYIETGANISYPEVYQTSECEAL